LRNHAGGGAVDAARRSSVRRLENNVHVTIGEEIYFLSGEGFLMPSKKDQPDLRYFKQGTK
jgi:hypothetical protein